MTDQLMKTHIELPYRGNILRGYLDQPAPSGLEQPQPLIIMFHGFTADCTETKFFFTRLSKILAGQGIASLRLSFTGSGESDGDFVNTSCLRQAEEAEAILDFALNLPGVDPRRIALLGMSMGGCSAALLARKRQNSLKGLILLAPAFRYVEKYRANYERSDFYWHGNLKVGRAFFDDALTADFRGALEALTIPVRFFHGTRDTSVSPEVSREFSQYAMDSRLTLIEGTNHIFDTREGFEKLSLGVALASLEMLSQANP